MRWSRRSSPRPAFAASFSPSPPTATVAESSTCSSLSHTTLLEPRVRLWLTAGCDCLSSSALCRTLRVVSQRDTARVILLRCGLAPSYLIGGALTTTGLNAHWGTGEWLVVEADESDGTFLKLPATVSVVTNVDPDHLDFYGSLAEIPGRIRPAWRSRRTCRNAAPFGANGRPRT